jgi:hypothetical protein
MALLGNAPVPSPSAASPSFSETWISRDIYDLSQVMGPSASPGFPDGGGQLALPPENFSNLPGVGGHFDWSMQPGLTDQDAAVRREHLAYYFSHVRGLQFLFTCKTALEAVQAVSADLTFGLCL